MFSKKSDKPSSLQVEIDRLLQTLSNTPPTADEYAPIVENLAKLHKLQENEKSQGISSDAKATIIANLAGLLVIIGHERVHVVATKALGFVTKLR